MSEAIGQPGGAALPRPMGIGAILGTAWQFYRRHWQTLLAIAAVVVVPLTLLQYLLDEWVRTQGEVTETTSNGVVVSTPSWTAATAGLLATLAAILMFLVLTGAITRAVAAEVVGEDPSIEQSYRFGFHRLGSVLLVSVLVGLATLAGLIVFVLPGIYIGVRLAVSIEALVVEGRRGTQGFERWSAQADRLIRVVTPTNGAMERLRRSNPVSWAWQDLNLLPHPYQHSGERAVRTGVSAGRGQPYRVKYRF
jgi:hypothetical protein